MIGFRMVRITTKQFAMLSENLPEKLGLTINVEPSYDKVNHLIGLDSTFIVDSDSQKIIILELFCEFEIAPNDWESQTKENIVTIPKQILDFMLSQVVGVSRGVLFCKTENTPFNKLILPPVNVTSMITEDMKIEL